jgi:hypothetical protein
MRDNLHSHSHAPSLFLLPSYPFSSLLRPLEVPPQSVVYPAAVLVPPVPPWEVVGAEALFQAVPLPLSSIPQTPPSTSLRILPP